MCWMYKKEADMVVRAHYRNHYLVKSISHSPSSIKMQEFNIAQQADVKHYKNEKDRNIQIWGLPQPRVKRVTLIGGKCLRLNFALDSVVISLVKVYTSMIFSLYHTKLCTSG